MIHSATREFVGAILVAQAGDLMNAALAIAVAARKTVRREYFIVVFFTGVLGKQSKNRLQRLYLTCSHRPIRPMGPTSGSCRLTNFRERLDAIAGVQANLIATRLFRGI